MLLRKALPLLALLAVLQGPAAARAAEPIPADQFDSLREMIKPLPGEYDWLWTIPWQISIQAARERAIAEDKPIMFWTAVDGNPLGST
jgi:hypothetical protein